MAVDRRDSRSARPAPRLDDAWQRLTPSFQASRAGGFEDYRAFWAVFDQVTVRGASPANGDEVDATVTFRYPDGRELNERTLLRLAFQNGVWKIDGQRQVNRPGVSGELRA